MEGLDLATQLFSAPTREALVARIRREQAAVAATARATVEPAPAPPEPAPLRRLERVAVPAPPDLERHVLRDVPLIHLYPYLNLQMLYGKHLGVRGLVERLLEARDPKVLEVHEIVETLKRDAVARGLFRAHGAYRWYRVRAAANTVVLFDATGREAATFDFPRQKDGERPCPNLAEQATLFRLLGPETFGLDLAEGFMMDPEASVSALVLHHTAAKYFKAD